MTTEILLSDHHVVCREAIRSLIDDEDDFAVVAEASDGREALALALRLKPDIVVTEISTPRLSGIEVIRRLNQENPPVRVLVLSSHEGRSAVEQSLRAGAVGYVPKSATAGELMQALHVLREGRSFVSPSVAQHLIYAISGRQGCEATPEELTGREREVLQLIAEGLSSKEVATELGVATRTVESHRASVMDKLGIHKVSGLVRFAIREGLLSP